MRDLGPRYEERVRRLVEQLEEDGLAALVVWHTPNIRYLVGFTGSTGVLAVTRDGPALFSDFRYRLQAEEEAPLARFIEVKSRLAPDLVSFLEPIGGTAGLEESSLTVEAWNELRDKLEDRGIAYRFAQGIVERLRETKDSGEIERIQEASQLVSGAFAELERMHVVGRTEAEVALDLETWVRRQGSEPVPFPYIVAGGPRGAMPHAVASHKPIPAHTLVVVDIGATVAGYSADMSRTFATGTVSEDERHAYEVVRGAQEEALAKAVAGARCADVDRAARGVVEAAGMGDLFGHGVGHGVGLEVHERPRLGARSEGRLRAGMTTTIEPGVYMPGVAGVRIEDTVLVEAAGARPLTDYPRDIRRLV